MMPIRKVFPSLFLLFALLPVHGLPADSTREKSSHTTGTTLAKEPYSHERFEQLQSQDAVVVIDVHAAWCPTCAKQQAALESYREINPDKKFFILEIDFDTQKDFVRHFRAPRQSTLLIYKGREQFWFSVGETRPAVITAELDKAITFKPRS